MLAHPLDLSYLGVSTIWMEDLGECSQISVLVTLTDHVQVNAQLYGSLRDPVPLIEPLGHAVSVPSARGVSFPCSTGWNRGNLFIASYC